MRRIPRLPASLSPHLRLYPKTTSGYTEGVEQSFVTSSVRYCRLAGPLLWIALFSSLLPGCGHMFTKTPPPVLGAAPVKTVVETNSVSQTASQSGFYAACSQTDRDSHAGPWTGPLRKTREESLSDARKHNTENREHRAVVLEF